MTQKNSSIDMKSFATQVVQSLRSKGFTAYFAGGCVRDQLLRRPPKDYDVATDATPVQVREVFGHRRTLAIGASFGVITVLGPKPHQVEVATFRNDGEYSDGRHPDGVTFSTAEEDAARRDFTINGMFFDPLEAKVIDFVGGQSDLNAKLVRAIGDPLHRIAEDKLRMLRAVRFAATYDLKIESQTMEAVQSQAKHLVAVSQERVTSELLRMLDHPNRSIAMQLLHDSGLLPQVLPPLVVLIDQEEAWARLLRLLKHDKIRCGTVAIGMIVGREGADLNDSLTDAFCRKLKLSNDQRKIVVWMVAHRKSLELATTAKFSELQPLLIQRNEAESTLCVMEAAAAHDGSSIDAIVRCRELLALPSEQLDPPLLLGGKDLMAMGMKPGPQFARLLHTLRAAQLDGEIVTKQAANDFVRELSSEIRD